MASRSLRAFRPVRIEEPNATHLPYLWAAYRRGSFAAALPDGMLPSNFGIALDGFYAGRRVWIIRATTSAGIIPIGIISGMPRWRTLEPHAIWFPEATARTILEAYIAFGNTVGRLSPILCIVPKRMDKLLERVARYTKVRKVGYIEGCYDDGDAVVYQSLA